MVVAMPGYSWVHTYEWMQTSYSVQQTKDGGYIVTGATWGEENVPDVGVIKTDSLGDTIWTRIYGRTGKDVGRCVKQTSDGGYIIVGSVDGVEYSPGKLWLLRTDANGDTVWTKRYGCGFGEEEGYWVEQTTDGGYIITGTSNPTGGMNNRLWLLKTDANGDTIWTRTFNFCSHGYCVRQTMEGGYIISSSWGLIKTNSSGDTLWTNRHVGSCVVQTKDGGYVITGIKWDSYWYTDITLIKTNPVGDSLWGHSWGGADDDASTCVQQTTDGGYILVGSSNSFGGIWLLKTNVDGDTAWTRILSKGGGNSLQQTSDNGYIIAGYGPCSTTVLSLVLIKTDSLGNVGVSEPTTSPAQTNWQMVSPVGSQVTLRYENLPQGFHAIVFDASGRKVDEIQSKVESGTITWGQGVGVGVYFVRAESSHPITKKIVLIR